MNYYGASGVKRVTMPEASYYLCLYLFWFIKESEYKNYALASIIFVNVCLIYCIWMGKSSFDYWKMREEKTGRCSLVWLYITGLVSTKLLKSRPPEKPLVDFCTSALQSLTGSLQGRITYKEIPVVITGNGFEEYNFLLFW
jgi:hypothetical protein